MDIDNRGTPALEVEAEDLEPSQPPDLREIPEALIAWSVQKTFIFSS